jgi:hypothetical protein
VSGAVPIASDGAILAEGIQAAVLRPLLYARVVLARDDDGHPPRASTQGRGKSKLVASTTAPNLAPEPRH